MTAEIIQLEISKPTHEEVFNRALEALEHCTDAAERQERLRAAALSAAVAADESEFLVCMARDTVIELLCSLDTKQPSYQPRSHAENIEMLHDLMNLLDGRSA